MLPALMRGELPVLILELLNLFTYTTTGESESRVVSRNMRVLIG